MSWSRFGLPRTVDGRRGLPVGRLVAVTLTRWGLPVVDGVALDHPRLDEAGEAIGRIRQLASWGAAMVTPGLARRGRAHVVAHEAWVMGLHHMGDPTAEAWVVWPEGCSATSNPALEVGGVVAYTFRRPPARELAPHAPARWTGERRKADGSRTWRGGM